MPKITITDIDGTIIEQGQPVENVLDYIDELELEVIVLTNRPESDRDRTVQDLEDADLEYTRLIMNGGSLPAPEFKKGEVKKLLDEGFDPEVFIDNDKANRDAVASLGVKVLDPADIPQSAEMPEQSTEDMPEDNSVAVAKLTKFMTIEEQLIKAVAELTSASAERDELRASLESAVAKEASDFKTTLEQNASLVIERDALAKEKAELIAQISELQTKNVSASVEAAKIASSVGINPVELSPADKSGDEPVKAVNHLEVFLAMDMGAERSAYFAKHKNEIVRAI
jgi:hypothetical protein